MKRVHDIDGVTGTDRDPQRMIELPTPIASPPKGVQRFACEREPKHLVPTGVDRIENRLFLIDCHSNRRDHLSFRSDEMGKTTFGIKDSNPTELRIGDVEIPTSIQEHIDRFEQVAIRSERANRLGFP